MSFLARPSGCIGGCGFGVSAVEAALLRLLGFGEEIDLLGDDLAAVLGLAFGIGPAGVVDAASDHDHRALGDVLGDAFADAVEAGDPVPFGLGLATAICVLEAARGGEREAGDCGSRLGGAEFGIVSSEADEGDGVLHDFDLSKLFKPSKEPSL